MRGRWQTFLWQAMLASSLCATGCKGAPDRFSVNSDPMMVSRKGILVAPEQARPRPILREPVPPAMPVTLKRPKEALDVQTVSVGSDVRLRTPAAPGAPVRAAAAGPELAPPTPPPPPVVRAAPMPAPVESRLVASAAPHVQGNYGHATDYAWLQGKIDRPYTGGVKLRFCNHAEHNPHGGNVFLQLDDRTRELKEGSIVMVEGKLLDNSAHCQGPKCFYAYPTYRVDRLTVVRNGQ